MGGDQVCPTNCAHASVGCQDDDWGQSGLQGSVQESETLDVQHMHLVDEQHARHQFSNSLVDVSVDHLVDFSSQLVSHLSLLGLHDLTHQTHEVVTTLWFGVGHVQIVKSYILNDFLLLMYVTFGQWHVFFSLQVILARISIASADSLDITC